MHFCWGHSQNSPQAQLVTFLKTLLNQENIKVVPLARGGSAQMLPLSERPFTEGHVTDCLMGAWHTASVAQLEAEGDAVKLALTQIAVICHHVHSMLPSRHLWGFSAAQFAAKENNNAVLLTSKI